MAGPTVFERALDIPGFSDRLASIRHYPERGADYAAPAFALHPRLAEKLEELGLDRLYTHQSIAFDAATQGRDVFALTGTSSGKTLCYALPILERCLAEPACRALIVYPTKALAQDQLGRLKELSPGPDVQIAAYDGDTPTSHRGAIRRMANIVLTNPDMLHVGILPGHEYWARFLKSLRFVVLDETHAYRGVFGSHVAGVMRRLLRLCEWHGSRPQIIACSATVGNPSELFGMLTGRAPIVIDADGAPRGPRSVAVLNSPADDSGARPSANLLSADLTASLVDRGIRCLTFSKARVSAELVLRYARDRLSESGGGKPNQIESYRSGYAAQERREIERALFDGELMALSSTNAMELGVDVGGLDAVVMNGYPGTIASFWQQAGRAGRGLREGLAVFVAHDDPLEQFLAREPAMLLDRPHEPIAVNPENPIILGQQLRCAAYERALAPSELEAFGESALPLAAELDRSGELEFRAGRFFLPSYDSPAHRIGIRGVGSDLVELIVQGTALGAMEYWRALRYAHVGAVYLHRGESYVVRTFDAAARRAFLEAERVPYYTQPIVQTVVEPKLEVARGPWGALSATLCAMSVTEQVSGFRRKSLDGDRVLSVEDLDSPPSSFDTLGVRLALAEFDAENPSGQASALHGLEHALAAVAPFLAGCDRGDLGSAWYALSPEDLLPSLFVFDRTPGGVGLCEKLFEVRDAWANAGYSLLRTCPCDDGCPACLLSSRCEYGNEALSKPGAAALLADLCS